VFDTEGDLRLPRDHSRRVLLQRDGAGDHGEAGILQVCPEGLEDRLVVGQARIGRGIGWIPELERGRLDARSGRRMLALACFGAHRPGRG
jgi:hypothetical protein